MHLDEDGEHAIQIAPRAGRLARWRQGGMHGHRDRALAPRGASSRR